MSGYSRSCSRADSSILLVAQCAAALSMMPASAPSCWAQGVTAASYNEYVIRVSPSAGIDGRDHRGSSILLPTGLFRSEYSAGRNLLILIEVVRGPGRGNAKPR